MVRQVNLNKRTTGLSESLAFEYYDLINKRDNKQKNFTSNRNTYTLAYFSEIALYLSSNACLPGKTVLCGTCNTNIKIIILNSPVENSNRGVEVYLRAN